MPFATVARAGQIADMRLLHHAFALTAAFLVPPSAFAAEVTNGDAEVRTVKITEQGIRAEIPVEPDGTVQLCPKGCFIAFPDGSMTVLTGTERILIVDGSGQPTP